MLKLWITGIFTLCVAAALSWQLYAPIAISIPSFLLSPAGQDITLPADRVERPSTLTTVQPFGSQISAIPAMGASTGSLALNQLLSGVRLGDTEHDVPSAQDVLELNGLDFASHLVAPMNALQETTLLESVNGAPLYPASRMSYFRLGGAGAPSGGGGGTGTPAGASAPSPPALVPPLPFNDVLDPSLLLLLNSAGGPQEAGSSLPPITQDVIGTPGQTPLPKDVPEPSTLLLLGTGLAASYAHSKARKSAQLSRRVAGK